MLKKKLIKLSFISLIILLNGCGFKVLDKSDANNFSIKEIITVETKELIIKLQIIYFFIQSKKGKMK